jgi:hypothetical protein
MVEMWSGGGREIDLSLWWVDAADDLTLWCS